ncbi:MAG: IS1595 family transposase [Cenarchaeum sp. SB0661_bin_35]|nr:IS1595 family transposase [Cenarchaeum sp. SB0667_bin_13]MYC79438.1 IS1595 family transposase [Cenarchaeum sp. SB0661_bin_35]MYI51377.1 IS1595 family transposase [Cenarchaeum sp. SB0673_bin_9]
MGPQSCIMAIFVNPVAAANLLMLVRWPDGVVCPHCKESSNIKKRGRYMTCLQRYYCKDCKRSFNDKTGTILHYKHVGPGQWMMLVWGFFGGPTNGMSINYLANEIGSYPVVYYLIKNMMTMVYNLPTKKLSGTVEHDEAYARAGSKGTKIDGKDGLYTIPSRRGLPRISGRGTYEKDLPMVTAAYQRADKTTRDCVVYNVHQGGKKLADIVEETVKPGSRVYTDEYMAYSSLGKRGYEHETVNHSEDEYASGENNEVHTNNCECVVGLLKWWQKKHRGVSKQNLHLYTKSYEFIRNHRHCNYTGRMLTAMSAILGTYRGREYYNEYNPKLAELIQMAA